VSDLFYPIALDLRDKRCLVVGGGAIAEGKLDALLGAGARVTLVSPAVRPAIAALAAAGRISIRQRTFEPADLAGAFIVIAATADRAINAEIAVASRAAGILVNAVDDPPFCDFYAVALVRRGALQVSISTNGLSPAFARWMREELDATLPGEYGELLAVLGDVRAELKARGQIPAYEHWQAAIDDCLLGDVRAGRHGAARRRALDRLTTPAAVASAGQVSHA
jgi:precorrin-2 dehydrogenase/sirohydrochlorin ferrochelatase